VYGAFKFLVAFVECSLERKCCVRRIKVNRHIHEDRGVPSFAVYIRILTESFDSN
jgi:hypothetical protein